ncbi:MAG: DUF2254 domain-containing protein [Opitutaceae bacterium]
MKTLFFKYWDRLRSGFWFLPSLMIAASTALAFGACALDEHVSVKDLQGFSWIYSGGAAGASAMLQTIASSMVSITGVVFSMTLVALTLASSQFGPRLLRNFMRDRVNQMVLGTFISTFLYCLLVLRTIRRPDEGAFVPHVSVTLGLAFALTSVCVLVYFIHHVAVSIQVDEIVVRVSAELTRGIDRLFPAEAGSAPNPAGEPIPMNFAAEASPVPTTEGGYLQLVDSDTLLKLAQNSDAIIQIERTPGAYFMPGDGLAAVWPAARITPEFTETLQSAFVFGKQRTPAQDVVFPIHELVEIAVRALSPGINDPFTAITCIDRLGTALLELAQRPSPSPLRHDEKGRLRVIAFPATFRQVTDEAFDQIRQYGRTCAPVTIRLLTTIAAIARQTRDPAKLAVLQRQADMIMRGTGEGLPAIEDRKLAEEHFMVVSRLTAREV